MGSSLANRSEPRSGVPECRGTEGGRGGAACPTCRPSTHQHCPLQEQPRRGGAGPQARPDPSCSEAVLEVTARPAPLHIRDSEVWRVGWGHLRMQI